MLDLLPISALEIVLDSISMEDAKALFEVGNRMLNVKMSNTPVNIYFGDALSGRTKYYYMLSFFKCIRYLSFWEADRNVLALLHDNVQSLVVHVRKEVEEDCFYKIQPLPANLTMLNLEHIPLNSEHALALPRSLTDLRTVSSTASSDPFREFVSSLPSLLRFKISLQSQWTRLNDECAQALPKSLTRLSVSTRGKVKKSFIANLHSNIESLSLTMSRPLSMLTLSPTVSELSLYQSYAYREVPWTADMFPMTLKKLQISGCAFVTREDIAKFALHLDSLSINGGRDGWDAMLVEEKEKLTKK